MKLARAALIGLILAALLLAGCVPTSPAQQTTREAKIDGGSYWNITPSQLKTMLEKKDFPLVNVHIPYDGEIAGTDLFLPYNEIEGNLSKLPGNKGAKIVLYCRSGSMSDTAARTLVKSGFTNVWNLDGGMIAWQKEGYKLIHSPR